MAPQRDSPTPPPGAPPDPESLVALLQSLYDQRFTGKLTLHYHQGKARFAEIPGKPQQTLKISP